MSGEGGTLAHFLLLQSQPPCRSHDHPHGCSHGHPSRRRLALAPNACALCLQAADAFFFLWFSLSVSSLYSAGVRLDPQCPAWSALCLVKWGPAGSPVGGPISTGGALPSVESAEGGPGEPVRFQPSLAIL